MSNLQIYTDLLERFCLLEKNKQYCNLKSFKGLLHNFSKITGKENLKDYSALLANYTRICKESYEKNRITAPHFNPFELFKLKKYELTHSNVLAWLFDPYESHNQGDLFFKCFVNYFGYEIKYTPVAYKVVREYWGEESIIDINIYSENYIFYIENKTLSAEGIDQTNREYRDVMKLAKAMNIDANNVHMIFVSPRGDTPENKSFTPISYWELANAIETSINEIKSDYIRYFIKSWLHILRSI